MFRHGDKDDGEAAIGKQAVERTGGGSISRPQSGNCIPPDLRTATPGGAPQQAVRPLSGPRSGAVGRAAVDLATVTLEPIRYKDNGGFYVELQGNRLIMVVPLESARPSKSGRTNVIASTRGPRVTEAEIDGQPIMVNVTALVNPNRPRYKQRIDAILSRWAGKQAARVKP